MKYRYQGPVDSSVTLKVGGKDQDVMLFRGKPVELPEGHDYVQTLVALGYLVPESDEPAVPQPQAPADAPDSTLKKGAK